MLDPVVIGGCTEKLGVAPHTYGDWTVVTPPTATVDGEQEHICSVCGYIYDEAAGDPDNGIAPGTAWEDVPEDFVCPLCGVGKDQFEEA